MLKIKLLPPDYKVTSGKGKVITLFKQFLSNNGNT